MKGDPVGIVQETEIWIYYQILQAQTKINPGDWDELNSPGFLGPLIPDRRPAQVIVNLKKERKKRTFWADNRTNNIEDEKRDKYLDHARGLRICEGDGDTSCNWSVCNGPQMFGKWG